MFTLLLCARPEFSHPNMRRSPEWARGRLDFALSLAQLANFAIDGVVRDAAIVAPQPMQLAEIADHAGCALYDSQSAGWAQALKNARCSQIVILQAGYGLELQFSEEASAPSDVVLALYAKPKTLWRRFWRAGGRPVGLIAAKDMLARAESADPEKFPFTVARNFKVRPHCGYARALQ